MTSDAEIQPVAAAGRGTRWLRIGAIATVISLGQAYTDARVDSAHHHQHGGRNCRGPETLGTLPTRPELGRGRTSVGASSASSANRSCRVFMGAPIESLTHQHAMREAFRGVRLGTGSRQGHLVVPKAQKVRHCVRQRVRGSRAGATPGGAVQRVPSSVMVWRSWTPDAIVRMDGPRPSAVERRWWPECDRPRSPHLGHTRMRRNRKTLSGRLRDASPEAGGHAKPPVASSIPAVGRAHRRWNLPN